MPSLMSPSLGELVNAHVSFVSTDTLAIMAVFGYLHGGWLGGLSLIDEFSFIQLACQTKSGSLYRNSFPSAGLG
jgi:hypothetical protein